MLFNTFNLSKEAKLLAISFTSLLASPKLSAITPLLSATSLNVSPNVSDIVPPPLEPPFTPSLKSDKIPLTTLAILLNTTVKALARAISPGITAFHIGITIFPRLVLSSAKAIDKRLALPAGLSNSRANAPFACPNCCSTIIVNAIARWAEVNSAPIVATPLAYAYCLMVSSLNTIPYLVNTSLLPLNALLKSSWAWAISTL